LSSITYVLSVAAENDLDDIYDFTAANFGDEKAVEYLLGLESLFCALAAQLLLGRMRPEVRDGLRSISYVSHIVFYRHQASSVKIVRVLHASRDLSRHIS
jgi:toxin ParE1/3/4